VRWLRNLGLNLTDAIEPVKNLIARRAMDWRGICRNWRGGGGNFTLAREEKVIMMPFEKCPVCGGELVEKEVEKLLRGGIHTAVIRVPAEVCLHCGERFYAQETASYFEANQD